MPQPFITITEDMVGKSSIRAFGRVRSLTNVLGVVQSIDVGKRVYKDGEVLQVENDEQRDRRVSRGSRHRLQETSLQQVREIFEGYGIPVYDYYEDGGCVVNNEDFLVRTFDFHAIIDHKVTSHRLVAFGHGDLDTGEIAEYQTKLSTNWDREREQK